MKKITSLFYVNSNGKKPVREWLLSLDKADRKIIGEDIKTVEYGFPIGMPTCRKLGVCRINPMKPIIRYNNIYS